MIRRRPSAAKRFGDQRPLSGVLVAGLRRALRGEPMKATTRQRLSALGYIEKVQDRFSRLTPSGLKVLQSLAQNPKTTPQIEP